MSVVLLGSTSGSVTLQEPAVAGSTVIDLPATSGTMAVTSGSPSFTNITATGTLTVNGNTTLGDASTDTILMTGAPSIGGAGLGMGMGFRNRIINGAMVINQRGFASSNAVVNGAYYVDRFATYTSTASDFLVGQGLNSITPPDGFINYLGFQSSIATSPGASDYHFTTQTIEGLNITDLGWGTAGAKSITISFWVRSSLTGAFGGAVTNGPSTRSYPFSYTISAANTWEQKSVTIPGDTSGTWLTTNGIGMYVRFAFGTGSSRSGTASTWANANYDAPTGSTSITTTSGATFYITGVQLEKGSTATSFDYRPYGTELALCQRYYYKMVSGNAKQFSVGTYYSAVLFAATSFFPVTMRTAPSLDYTTGTGYYVIYSNNASDNFDAFGAVRVSETIAGFDTSTGTSGTQGYGGVMVTNNVSSYVGFSAEL